MRTSSRFKSTWFRITAREKNLRFQAHHGETSGWYSSRRVGEDYSGFKVLVEEDSNQVLGAHLLGPHADEGLLTFLQLQFKME